MLTKTDLIFQDLLKEAEERFEINLQETSATITELKKYYEEKLQTGEGELERIVEQCNTAQVETDTQYHIHTYIYNTHIFKSYIWSYISSQRERDHLAKSFQAAEESYQDLNKKYLLSERSNKSQTIIIEDLNEQVGMNISFYTMAIETSSKLICVECEADRKDKATRRLLRHAGAVARGNKRVSER